MAFFPANFMLQSPQHHQQEDQDHHHHNHNHNNNTNSSFNHPNILSSSCTTTTHHPQDFHHALSSGLMGKRSMSFSGIEMHHHDHQDLNMNGGDDDLSDDGSQAGEKKRRLNLEQVKTLEKNFELGNKLEPERKMQLARALGLQPRQIAIWFQNRRARWKTKQLEKDYDLLKRQFEAIKADNDSLQAHNKKLHAEIVALKTREVVPTESINLNKETEGSCSNRSENSSDLNLDISRTPAIDSPLSSHPNSRPLFPTSMNIRQQTSMVQLLQNSSRPDHLQCPTKAVDPTAVQDEAGGFCNMFCTIDDQSGFWPWPEHQQFH